MNWVHYRLEHPNSVIPLGMYRIVNFTIRPEPDSTKVVPGASPADAELAAMSKKTLRLHYATALRRTLYTPPPCNRPDRLRNDPKCYCFSSQTYQYYFCHLYIEKLLAPLNKLSGCTVRRRPIFLLEPEPDSKKWPDIRPTGTGYPVHP